MNFLQDVKFGIRMLFKSPGFTVVSVLTLALGIGSCAAIFSLVNALLIQPLPYADPDRVVFVLGWDVQNDDMRFNVSAVDFADWKDIEAVFDGAEGYRYWSVNLTEVEVPQRLQGYQVTPGIFSMLGVRPALGRDFDVQEVASGAAHETILSHRIWQNEFQGDAGVIGRIVSLNDVPHTIIGVMPPRFEFPQGNFRGDIWAPISIDASQFESRGDSFSMVAVARLKQDVPIEQAQARMDTIYETLALDHPDTNAGLGVRLLPFKEFLVGTVRPALLALMGAVGFLLFIACANVANLLLVRSKSRQREIAIRTALGAGRLRLVRQLCIEHLFLALLACGLGIVIAQWTLDVLLGSMPEIFVRVMPALFEAEVDSTVLVFSAGLALVTGLVFSLLPAFAATRANLTDSLKDGAQGTMGREKRQLSQVLVGVELALSVLLLVGAGLLMRSFGNLRDVDLGFDSTGVISMRVSLPQERYPDEPATIAFYDEFLQRVNSSPGVVQAGLVNSMPFSTSNSSGSIEVEGQGPLVDGRRPRSDIRNISPGYFQTIGMRLLEGRDFDERDRTDSSPVVIVNETFVQKYLSGQAPIGVRLRSNPDSETPWREIIGVVNDIKHFNLTTEYQPEFYVPYRQVTRGAMTLVARSEGDPMNLVGIVRGQLSGLDPNMPLFDVMTLNRAVANSMFGPMITASLMSGFAIIAALLAAVGLYGLISYSVSQRHAEIGLRIALGASQRNVLMLVMRSGLIVTAGGIVVGFALAFGLTQVLTSILYDLTPADPLTYAGVAVALSVVVMLAHYLPARKASHIDPMTALRCD